MKPRTDSWTGFKQKPSIGDKYLTWYLCVLLGYALLGRGFAYLGLAPVYIGEFTLALGLLAWLLNRHGLKVFELLTAWFLVGFMLWGCLRTLPYVSEYGVDALRDGVLWAYGAFAFVIATLLIAKPERLQVLIDRYGRFIVVFSALAPVVMLLTLLYSEALPHLPGAPVPLVSAKPGDLLVHLAGVAAFMLVGLGIAPLFVVIMTCINFPLIALNNRGGMLAFLTSVSLIALLRPLSGKLWRLLAIGVIAIVVFGLSGISVDIPGEERDLSFEQLASNVQSVSSDQSDGGLSQTKEWRLKWWDKIIGYTFDGQYFWTGKGFGINLANDDGFQVEADESLRSPHNGHLTILARSGVPGLGLWLLVQLGWSLGLLSGYLRSRLNGERKWAGLFLFLLAYWAAFLVNASFDVSLEGPMMGIWFWTIIGVGLAAMWIYKYQPEALDGNGPALTQGHYHQSGDEEVLSVPRSDATS